MITIQDLARECEVSIATISRAFSPNGRIHPETKEKILKKAQELHYVPNTVARSLQGRQTHSVGLIVPEISNSFYISAIQRMEARYRDKGYRIMIGFYQQGTSNEAEIIYDMHSSRVDALLFSPTDRSSEKILKQYFPPNHVLQLFSKHYEEYSSLCFDDIRGTELATEYLIGKGHTRIMYFGEQERSVGYQRVMAAHKLSTDGLLYASRRLDAYDAETCIVATRPTAILAIAKWSERIVSALNRLHLRFPDDIGLLVYDDVEWASMFDVTAVGHPLEEVAERSANILLHILNQNEHFTPIHELAMPFITERKSVPSIHRIQTAI